MIKIGFFGTPELASRCLEELHQSYEISFVVTAEDKPQGRNRSVQSSPAKEAALKLGLTVLQPPSIKDPDFIQVVTGSGADIFVVVAYGRIITPEIFDYPPLKTINLHPSLLPKYRGAAPMQWALMNGDDVTGITVQRMEEELDSGAIVVQENIPLELEMTFADLYGIVLERGPGLLCRAVEMLSSGDADLIPQDHEKATYCRKIDRDVAHIDWNRSALEIHNLVRALNPKPVAYSTFRGDVIKIWRTRPVEPHEDHHGSVTYKPGSIVASDKKRLLVMTGKGLLEVMLLQPAGKKVMDGLSFINGYRPKAGDSL